MRRIFIGIRSNRREALQWQGVRFGLAFSVLFGFIGIPASGQSETPAKTGDPSELVRIGNDAFAEGDYQKAIEFYGHADVSMPESPEIAYNRGVALYKMGDYVAARAALSQALSTRDLGLEAKTKFNLGNVSYSSALEKMSAPQEAIDLLKQAISHYRDSLVLKKDDEDALANIQTAQLLIKDLLDKLKQQQEQQQQQGDPNQQQDQQEGDQQQQDQQSEQQDDQQSGEQDQQQGGESQDQDQEQEQSGEQGQDQQEQDGQLDRQDQQQKEQQQAGEPQEAREMTQEEAERLLQSVRDREKERRDEKARRMRARRVPVSKDW